MILAAEARPASKSLKAAGPSSNLRISAQSSEPNRPAAIASTVDPKSVGVYV